MTDNLNEALNEARRLVQRAELNLQTAIQRLERAEKEARNNIPPEPGAEVLTFSLNLDGRSSYRFAALKAGGRWYTTGRTVQAHGVTWEALVKWIRDHNCGQHVYLCGAAPGAAIVAIETR